MQSVNWRLDELQEVAGYLGLEEDEFEDIGYDSRCRKKARLKVRRASQTRIPHKHKILDTKGATQYEFNLIAPFLCWYQEILRDVGKDGVIPADADEDDNVKFLRQVWNDKGYGVDCYPQDLSSPFTPIPSPNCKQYLKDKTQFAMSSINDHSREKYKKTYTLVEVEDAVWTQTLCYYFTFKVKQDDSDVEGGVERIRAIVSVSPPRTRLLEYKLLLIDGNWDLNIVTQYHDF